jgi:hypothetical protein
MDMNMDMGGMDMSDAGMFTGGNMHVAHVYWYIVVTVVGILTARRLIDRGRIIIEYNIIVIKILDNMD